MTQAAKLTHLEHDAYLAHERAIMANAFGDESTAILYATLYVQAHKALVAMREPAKPTTWKAAVNRLLGVR